MKSQNFHGKDIRTSKLKTLFYSINYDESINMHTNRNSLFTIIHNLLAFAWVDEKQGKHYQQRFSAPFSMDYICFYSFNVQSFYFFFLCCFYFSAVIKQFYVIFLICEVSSIVTLSIYGSFYCLGKCMKTQIRFVLFFFSKNLLNISAYKWLWPMAI